MVKLIVAVGPKGLIGYGDKMPWHIPKEFKHFKETTIGHTLFMGGTTFKGLPGKLPNRKMVVFDKKNINGADEMITSMEQAKQYLIDNKNTSEIIFIAGGKFVYETFGKYASEWIVSHVETESQGDVFLNLDFTKYRSELVLKEEKFNVYKYFL